MLGHDAHDGERVEQRVEGLVEHDVDVRRARGGGLVDVAQVELGALEGLDAVDGEGDVLRREGLPVREPCVVADVKRPGQAIGAARIGRREVVFKVEVGVGGHERGLQQRLVHVLAGPPPHERIEAGGRFRGGRHGDYHLAYAVGTDAGTRRAGSHRFVRARVCRSPCAPRQKRDAPRRSGKSRCTHEVPSRQGHGFSSCWCYVSSMRNNTIGEPPVLRNFDS